MVTHQRAATLPDETRRDKTTMQQLGYRSRRWPRETGNETERHIDFRTGSRRVEPRQPIFPRVEIFKKKKRRE